MGTEVGTPRALRIAMQGYHEPKDGLTDFGKVSAAGSTNLEHFLLFHASLTAYDAESTITPRLAQKVPSLQDGDWIARPDGGMDVTWKLRPGLVWQDGTPLTSEDFAFGFQVANDPDLPVTRVAWWRLIGTVETPDPQTLVVRWTQPSILGNVSGTDGIPALPRHLLQDFYAAGEKQTFSNSPFWTTEFLGLGPYRLTRWERGSFIEAQAFDRYALGRPKIDRILLRYVGDVNAIIAGLLAGEYDVVPYGALFDAGPVATIRQAWGEDRGTTVTMEKGVRAIWLQFRDQTAPWVRDLRVRQGLAHALDKQALSDALQAGIAGPVDMVLPPTDPAYHVAEQRGVSKYPFDTARARHLFAEAGWLSADDGQLRGGAGQALFAELSATAQGDNVPELEAVAAQWTAVGVRATLAPIPPQSTNRDELKNTMRGALLWPWNFGLSVPQSLTSGQIASEATRWRGNNYGGYFSAAYDGLYEQFQTTLDPLQRQDVTARLAQYVASDLPVIPIYYNIQAVTFRNGVVGPGRASPQQAASAWNIETWEIR